MRHLCITLSLLLSAQFSCGQYVRHIYTGKGEKQDVSSSRPLSYWTVNPLDHDEGVDLCLECKLDNGKIVSKIDYRAKVESRVLGEVDGHKIVQFLYHVTGDTDVQSIWVDATWKILVVASKPGEFAEIFHLQPWGMTVNPTSARVLKARSESILMTNDSDGGNGGGCWDGYWWFDAQGPHSVNFDPVYKAIGEAVQAKTSKKATYSEMCWTIDIDQQRIHTGVQEIDAPCHACGQLGTATADFEIVHGVAQPKHVEFDYDPQE